MNRMKLSSFVGVVAVLLSVAGCSQTYKGIAKPAPKLSKLSPELEALSDPGMKEFLSADIKTEFPTNLAIARIGSFAGDRGYYYRDDVGVGVITGEEADAWRAMTKRITRAGKPAFNQVHFVSPLLTPEKPNLKQLRDAAALLRAPLLLVYTQDDNYAHGQNPAAMAYWTIIGLFLVPGDTVGHYSACSGVLLETRTGIVLATFDGDGKKEENVLAGAVSIASDRVRKVAQYDAFKEFQKHAGESLSALATEATASTE